MTTKPSAVMPQIGRPTSSNDPTSFGSEITRLTGELLADTTQMAPYTQITWEPRLKTLTSLQTHLPRQRLVDLTNTSTSGEMSVWIALHSQRMKKADTLCRSTLIISVCPAISTQARRPYIARTTLECTVLQIPNSVAPQTRVIRLSSGSEANSTLTKKHSFIDGDKSVGIWQLIRLGMKLMDYLTKLVSFF